MLFKQHNRKKKWKNYKILTALHNVETSCTSISSPKVKNVLSTQANSPDSQFPNYNFYLILLLWSVEVLMPQLFSHEGFHHLLVYDLHMICLFLF